MSDGNDNTSGGRSLGGGPAEPLPSSWANRSSANPRVGRVGGPSTSAAPRPSGQGRLATLSDLTGSGGPPRGRQQQRDASSGPGDDDDEEEEGERWFAGGERSGISVENPDRPARTGGLGSVRDILRKAAEGGPPPEAEPSEQGRSAFFGGGHVLGSDEIPSEFVPDPNETPAIDEGETMETAIREIIFWRDGYSIQDGPLMRYDDPANARILDMINSGNAPPSVLNVQIGQPVELRVSKRLNEDYVQPPKRFGLFEGEGNRLGSPLPGNLASSSTTQQHPPGAFPASSSSAPRLPRNEPESLSTKFEVDMTAPTTSVQIRLADGTRLVSRMNLTHTVGDIRGFINASRPGQSSVPYTIGTTFPNRVLDNDSLTIEAAKLQNSVIVQRTV